MGTARSKRETTVAKAGTARKKGQPVITHRPGHRPQAFAEGDISYAIIDDNNLLALIELVRNGLSTAYFNQIAGYTSFTAQEWASYLQLSERTLQRYQEKDQSFGPIQSERILELTMLYQYGVDVFGDKAAFDTWLTAKSVALGGRVPKELLDTQFGMGMIKDELGRIEHGVLA